MGITAKQFVESLSSHSILPAGEISTLRGRLSEQLLAADAETLARELVKQGKLTRFQAAAIYHGRGKGLVLGEYVVLDKLGQGGMGQVFKARHRRMKRIAAIKLLPPHATTSERLVQRFYQEVQIVAQLSHPNIVAAYDAAEANGLHYLVMEYVDGQDLLNYLNKHGPLGIEQTVNCILQAARGLDYAHKQGVVHRDVKPANLLLDRQGIVKVLDLGLARIDSPLAADDKNELTGAGEIMGTVDYLAPEQALDTHRADHRADIYSLGCTLYRLLTNKPPYPADTTVARLMAHASEPIPSLRAARPEAPEALDRLFQKMVAKQPQGRVQTMADVVSQLQRIFEHEDPERSSIILGEEVQSEDYANFLDSLKAPSISAIGRAGPSQPAEQLPAAEDVPQYEPRSSHSGIRRGRPKKTERAQAPAASANRHRARLLMLGLSGVISVLILAVGAILWSRSGTQDGRLVAGGGNNSGLAGGDSAAAQPANQVAPANASASHNPPDPAPRATSQPDHAAGTSTSIPEPRSRGVPVDLMTLLDLDQDVVYGTWKKDGAAVVADAVATPSTLQFSTVAPAEYELTLGLDVPVGHDALVLGLRWGGKRFVAVLDAGKDRISGLQLVDGKRVGGNETMRKGPLLVENQTNTIVARVLEGGVHVLINGQPQIAFAGPPARVTPDPQNEIPDPIKLFVSTWRTPYKLTKVELTPLNENTPPVPAMVAAPAAQQPDSLTATIDLLKQVDVKGPGVAGNWAFANGTLASPGDVNGWLQVPFYPPAEYDLTAVVERTAGNNAFGMGLLVGDRLVAAMFGGSYGNLVGAISGLDTLSGAQFWSNPTTTARPVLIAGKAATLLCGVRRNRVFALVDGELLFDWSGDPGQVKLPDWLAVPDFRRLFLASVASGFKITRWEISPATVIPPPSGGNVPIDLLARVDAKRDAVTGDWRFEQGRLIVDPSTTSSYKRLSAAAPHGKRYVLHAHVERLDGSEALAIGLPIGPRRVTVLLDYTNSSISGLGAVQGSFHSGNTAPMPHPLLPPYVVRAVTCYVDGVVGSIRVTLDGGTLIDWRGDIAALGEWDQWSVGNIEAHYVGAWNAPDSFRFSRLELVPLDWQRLQVPSVAERESSRGELKEVLTSPAKNAPASAKRAAAESLIREAAYRLQRPAARYLLLDEAARMAGDAGDVPLAFVAIDDLAAVFDVDRRQLCKESFAEMFKSARTPAQKQQLADQALLQMDREAAREQFGVALDLQATVQSQVKGSTSELGKELRMRGIEYAFWLAEREASELSQATLARTPNDAAHAALGRYLALVPRDIWSAKQHFTQASASPLRTAVSQEVSAPREPDEQASLGDLWWDLAEQEKTGSPLKILYMERAAQWYERALPRAVGKTRTAIDQHRLKLADQRKRNGALFAQRHPLDATKVGNHWYKLYPQAVLWGTAKNTCERLGGRLVSCDAPGEAQAVAAAVVQQLGGKDGVSFWTGGNDADVEARWIWADGSPLTPSVMPWGTNQPDNNGNEDYAIITVTIDGGQVRASAEDRRDNELRAFVCEWDR